MVFTQPSLCPGEWNAQTPQGFWNTSGSHNLGQTTRLSYNQQEKKRTCRIVDFGVPADHRVTLKENEKRDKYHDLVRELKKKKTNRETWKWRWYQLYRHQRIDTGAGGLGNKRAMGDNLNYSVIRIGQNAEESSENLRKLVVTQTTVINHRLTLMGKTPKRVNNKRT